MGRTMAFDQDKKAKIRASMDYDANGRLTAVANKAAALDAPILIIGLGGTGVGAVLKVKKMIYDRLECERKDGEVMDKPANIEYLVMDTDVASKDKSVGGVGFSETLDETFVFTSSNIQAKLQSPSLPPFITNWIDKDIDVSEVTNGAGAVRQVGRFMLFDNIKRVVDALDTKIRRVTAGYENTTPLYVFLLAGISGGTGSGTFIDIAYLVKGITRKIDNNRIVNRIGLLFLPDVNLSVQGLSDTKRENIKKNGFAALKELDYLMNVNMTGDCFEQDYGTVKIGPKADGNIPPFETCILMSSKDKNGVTMVSPYEYTLSVAAETVINFIASEKNQNVTDFSINSFLSNDKDDCGTFVTMLGDSISPVNYKYAVAGGSSAVIPFDDIMSYMAYLAFQEIDGLWNRIPEENEVNELMQVFGLDAKNLEQQMCFGAPMINNLARHTYDLIKQSPQMIMAEYNGNFEQRKKYMKDKLKELHDNMEARIKEESNPINDIFKDINRGPVFAQRILYTTSMNPCLLKGIEELRRYFATNAPAPQVVEAKKQLADKKMNELLSPKPLFGSKTKIRDEAVNAMTDYYDILFKVESYSMLENLCGQYYNLFTDRNNEIYANVSELLGTLVELFNKYAAIKSETTETHNAATNSTTLNWSVVAVPTFIKELEERMGSDEELSVDLHGFIQKFYIYLFENVDIWSGKERADVVEKLNYFISVSFDKVLNKSMDFYIKFIANAIGKTEAEYSNEIFSELKQRSNIKFPVKATYSPIVENPSYSYVSIPMDAQNIKNVIKGGLNQKSIIKDSGIKDRIFMINFMSAMPLAAYGDLMACHEAYGNLSDYKHGLHLYEGKHVSWRELPSPLPQSEWEGGHFVEAEARQNERWREVFDKAVKYNFIQRKQEAGRDIFYCCWGDPIDANKILAANNVDLDKDIVAADALKVLDELMDRMDNQDRLDQSKPIYYGRMKHLDDGSKEIDVDFAKEIFIKMVAVRSKIALMVEDFERAEEVREKLKPFTVRKRLLSSYVKLMYTDTVIKQRGEYVYFDRNGAVQIFCSLESIQNYHPEYYLFNYFFNQKVQGNSKLTDELIELADKAYKEKRSTDESYNAMMDRLQEYVDTIKEKIADLKMEWRDIEDGQMVLSTYQELERIASAELLNR